MYELFLFEICQNLWMDTVVCLHWYMKKLTGTTTNSQHAKLLLFLINTHSRTVIFFQSFPQLIKQYPVGSFL